MPIVREGSFEAIFQNRQIDPSNSCWNSFNDMRKYYKKLPDYDYLFRPTFFFLVVKNYMEWQTLLFSFYWRCNLDKVNLDMSQQLQVKNMASTTGLATRLLIVYLTTINSESWQNKVIRAIDNANYYDTDESWKAVGVPIGKLMSKIFEYEIPNYDFMYGENERNYW